MNWDKRTVSKKEGIFRSEERSEKEGKGVNKIIGEGRLGSVIATGSYVVQILWGFFN